MIDIEIHEDKLSWPPKFQIKMPAVPREGETITLPDGHYLIDEVFWQVNPPGDDGYLYRDSMYYTIRIVVINKFREDSNESA